MELVQARDHFANPILADLLEFGHFGQQLWVLCIDEVAQKMQFTAVRFGGQFGGGDELQAGPSAGGSHAGASFHGVVVGQSDGDQAELSGAFDHFLRGVGAVGEIRVKMEVCEHCLTLGCGTRNRPWSVVRGPWCVVSATDHGRLTTDD